MVSIVTKEIPKQVSAEIIVIVLMAGHPGFEAW